MNPIKKAQRRRLSEQEIDRIVESQADDDSAGKTIRARNKKPASLCIPTDLAARAAFLARLHRDKKLEDWLTRVIKERVEMEEFAFIEAKREMSSRNGA
jgi:hypothetical protein